MMTENLPGHCDLCHAVTPIGETIWVYETPSTASKEQAAHGEGFWAEDPLWGVCGTCHERVQRLDRREITEEQFLLEQTRASLRNQGTVMVFGDPAFERKMQKEQIDFIVGVLKSFIAEKTDKVYSEVNRGVPSDRR